MSRLDARCYLHHDMLPEVWPRGATVWVPWGSSGWQPGVVVGVATNGRECMIEMYGSFARRPKRIMPAALRLRRADDERCGWGSICWDYENGVWAPCRSDARGAVSVWRAVPTKANQYRMVTRW